jgi:lipid A 3-O-deacylase
MMGEKNIGPRAACRVLTLAAGVAFGAAAAQAQPANPIFSEIRVGLQAHDVPVFSSRIESGVDINGEVLFTSPNVLRFLGSPRPHFGFSANTQGGMSQIYAGLSWEFRLWSGLFAGFSLGGAIHSGPLHNDVFPETQKAFGSRGLFRESIEIGWRFNNHNSLSIMMDHISNARLASPNPGLETIGVRYGYRF